VLFPLYSQIEPVFLAFKQLGEGWRLSDILKEFIGAAAFHDIYEIQNYNSFCLVLLLGMKIQNIISIIRLLIFWRESDFH